MPFALSVSDALFPISKSFLFVIKEIYNRLNNMKKNIRSEFGRLIKLDVK